MSPPARRTRHTKSRTGCLECKRRHIKCDETQPHCVNCQTGDRKCTYPPGAATVPGSRPSPPSSCGASSSLEHVQQDLSAATPVSPFSTTTYDVSDPTQLKQPINIHHARLFSHYFLKTAKIFGRDPIKSSRVNLSIETAVSTPFLYYRMLALAALHLSVEDPSQGQIYGDEAAYFHTESLILFNGFQGSATTTVGLPELLFARLLGYYLIADSVIKSQGENRVFFDSFVDCIQCHRGIQALSAASWHSISKNSTLSTVIESFQNSANAKLRSAELSLLWVLIGSTQLGERDRTLYQETVEQLEWTYFLERGALQADLDIVEAVSLWTIVLPPEFLNHVRRRTPEALVIIAHYAVLLHRRRNIWIYAGAGQLLIEFIVSYLGAYWQPWLEVPTQALLEDV